MFTELEPSGEVAFSEISEFDEWTTAAALTFGVTDHLELGLAVPFVRGHMSNEVLVGDDEPGTESDETGLGNVRLLAAAGWTWNDFSDNLLIEFETGLPTDSRGDDFAAGGDGRLAVTIEHYWERLGVIGVVAANYFAEEGFDDLNTTIDFLGGFGLELSSRAFLSMLAGGANGIAAGEATFELILGGGTSLEFFAGGDLEGDASARFAGVSVNFWPASR